MNSTLRTLGILSVCAALTWAILITPARLDRRIATESAAAREMARRQIEAAVDKSVVRLDAQITGLRGDVAIQGAEIRRTTTDSIRGVAVIADNRLSLIQDDANGHAAALEALAQAELIVLNRHVEPVLDGTASVLAQVDSAAPLYLDCEGNPSCAFNLFQGTAKATERTMQAIASAAPETSKAVSRGADAMAETAANLERQTAWPLKIGAAVKRAVRRIF